MARILVIDDDPGVLKAMSMLVEALGHEAIEALNGRDGLAAFARQPADVVLTDINMPGMDGIQVIRGIHKIAKGTPVIAMTGGGQLPPELLLDSASALGAVSAVPKPIDMDVLERALYTALAARE